MSMSSELKEEMSTMMSRMIEEHEVKLSSTLEAIMSRFLLSAKADSFRSPTLRTG